MMGIVQNTMNQPYLNRPPPTTTKSRIGLPGSTLEPSSPEENDELTYLNVDPEASFVCQFADGYSFRNLIEFIRVTNASGNFRFTPTGVVYEQGDPETVLVNQVVIEASELIHYEYHSRLDQVVIGINTADLRSHTKLIGKKDGLRLYKVANDPNLYIQKLDGASGRGQVSIVRPRPLEVVLYEFPDYQRPNNKADCVVLVSEFARMCTTMHSIKCRYVTIVAMPTAMLCKAIMDGGVVGCIIQLTSGDCATYAEGGCGSKDSISHATPEQEASHPYVNIKVDTIKTLAKLNNLSSSMAVIKMYLDHEDPLKLSCKVGTYGVLNVYVNSVSE